MSFTSVFWNFFPIACCYSTLLFHVIVTVMVITARGRQLYHVDETNPFPLFDIYVVLINHDAMTIFGDNAFSIFDSVSLGHVHRRGIPTPKDTLIKGRTLISHRMPKVHVIIYTEVLQKHVIMHASLFIPAVVLCKSKREIFFSDQKL